MAQFDAYYTMFNPQTKNYSPLYAPMSRPDHLARDRNDNFDLQRRPHSPSTTSSPNSSMPVPGSTPPPEFMVDPPAKVASIAATPEWKKALSIATPRSRTKAEAREKADSKPNGSPAILRSLLERVAAEPLQYLTARSQILMLMVQTYLCCVVLAVQPHPLFVCPPPYALTEEMIEVALHAVLSLVTTALDSTVVRVLQTARSKTLDRSSDLGVGEALKRFVEYFDVTFINAGMVSASVGSFYTHRQALLPMHPGRDVIVTLR